MINAKGLLDMVFTFLKDNPNIIIAIGALLFSLIIVSYVKSIIRKVSARVIRYFYANITFSALTAATPIIDKFVSANLKGYMFGFSLASIVTFAIAFYLKKREMDIARGRY